MEPSFRLVLVYTVVGLYIQNSIAQTLTTKCPDNAWTKHLERCYLVVDYSHSFPKALNYCQKYSARLVEPTGYVINNYVAGLVTQHIPDATQYRIGLNRSPDPAADATVAFWSTGHQTSLDVGVWGRRQPDIGAGDCAHVQLPSNQWHMGSCDTVMPFVCEMDPCPSAPTDTFMCNGKCIGTALVCDGKDDCGNNMDEQNCANLNTYMYTQNSGTLQLRQINNKYAPNEDILWTMISDPGTRITVKFTVFSTEEGVDFVEVYDGGPTLDTSDLAYRFSGTSATNFISSYNFLILRFVSDRANEKTGFTLTWTTEHQNEFTVLQGYSYTITETVNVEDLGSRLTTDRCRTLCGTGCFGFSYNPQVHECYFFNELPVLEIDENSELHTKTYPDFGTVKGSVTLFHENLIAASSGWQQLATPMYPNHYVGNFEREYVITAAANNPITLQAVTVDLCCGDYVYIYDKSHDLLETLTSASQPHYILSTGNTLYVRMELEMHGKCSGVLFLFSQGCNITYTGSDMITSPGYGTVKSYPDLIMCTFSINAPFPDRSITLLFEDFDLAAGDNLNYISSDGIEHTFTGTSLLQQSITVQSHVTLTFLTSSRDSGRGFLISFSPGCPSLQSMSYVLTSSSFNYGDAVTVSCADGYYFTEPYSDRSSVELTCLFDGVWSEPELPVCAQGFCGLVPGIQNGFIRAAGGIQGGDTAELGCNDGFTLTGSEQVSCQANNLWQARPTCTSPQCPLVSSVADTVTSTEVLLGDGSSQGSVVRLGCLSPNEIIGPETIACHQGQWDYAESLVPFCSYKPCEAPLITNGILSPAGPYIRDQELRLTCQEGYDVEGSQTFLCRPDEELPACTKKKCSIDNLDSALILSPDLDMYLYSDTVDVSCPTGFEFDATTTTSMTLTCLASGSWDRMPVCRRMRCGEPYQVGGSSYIYPNDVLCTDYGCSFELACQPKYERFGASSLGDHIVRCGQVYDGLWDFGDINCKGGQCFDPGYPPSGWLDAISFQANSLAMFHCFRPGYDVVDENGDPSEGIKCLYNLVTNAMEWDGEVPICEDIEPPVFRNCPESPLEVGKLETPGIVEPTAYDNNNINQLIITPPFFRIDQHISSATIVSYTAIDYADNVGICQFVIVIPRAIECLNDLSTVVEIGEISGTLTVGGESYVSRLEQGVTVIPLAPTVEITAERDTLRTVQQVEVKAYNSTGHEKDSCTVQFRVRAKECATWPLRMPNTITNCVPSENVCNLQCNSGYYFMDNPEATTVQMSCTNNVWNRSPPICASSTENYVRYTAAYIYKYTIEDGIVGVTECNAVYDPQVRAQLLSFATAMEGVCNVGNTNNPVNITLASLQLDHISGTNPHRMSVRFEFHFTVRDESAADTQSLKEQCADEIQDRLDLKQDISTIQTVSGSPGQGCGSGDFDTVTGHLSFHHTCLGNRKYYLIMRFCLECPLGYYYENVTTHDCIECPDGTYGARGADGTYCETCPNGAHPGTTGLKNVEGCYPLEICGPGEFSVTGLSPCKLCPNNFYNTDMASRTCVECANDEFTVNAGETSSGACLTEEVAAFNEVATPCSDDPCNGNGACSIKVHDYFCTCDSGFTGRDCDVVLTACHSNPCENGQSCTSISESPGFICECNLSPSPENELHGTYCEEDRFGCNGQCSNNATCHNQRGSYSCKCPTHGGFKNDGNCETPIDQCNENPCEWGSCIAHGSFYRSCLCVEGYTGLSCEENIDDCSPNPCQNGATCTDGLDSFTCTCLETYHGNLCQFRTACDNQCTGGVTWNCHNCDMTGTSQCRNVGNSYVCDCLPGYSGTNCETELSPCNSYPCQHGGTCTPLSSVAYECDCVEPWTGDDCDVQRNNCPDGSQCFNGGTCYSTPTGYQCDCPYNYIGPDCTVLYDLCIRANPCVGPGSTCSMMNNGEVQCSCLQGYSGTYCQTELPICTPTTCAHGGTCSDVGGVVTCSCAPGFTGSTCSENINDCESDPCTDTQECVDGINSYTCVCAPGKLGEMCNKDLSLDFDYIIKPKKLCRLEVSQVTFGDGTTDIITFSVAFWARYTHTPAGTGVLMSIYGSNAGDTAIPESPDFELIFKPDGADVVIKETGSSRRKREIRQLSFGTSIADGYWHHIAAVWINSTREINLYLDGTFKDQKFLPPPSLGTRMFLVFGAYDTVSGITDPTNSFEGLISRLHVQNNGWSDEDVAILSNSFTTAPSAGASELLYQERTLMLLYPVNYTSELTEGTCLAPGFRCNPLSTGVTVPVVSSCSDAAMALTPRGGSPNWQAPTFDVTPTSEALSNVVSGGTPMDWGVHGISYAVYDAQQNAAVCSFRLFNYKELNCNIGSSTTFNVDVAGGKRYSPNCLAGQNIAGDVPLFQLCNMYSMFNGDILYNYTYNYPVCSATSVRKAQTSMALDVQITNSDCETEMTLYRNSLRSNMQNFNANELDSKLCPTNCFPIFEGAALSCISGMNDRMRIQLDFGLLEPDMSYGGSPITAEEALKIAVGDRQLFNFDRDDVQVRPVLSSFDVASISACETGNELSGDICVACGAGTQYTDVCERCTVGMYKPAQSVSTSCISCHSSLTTIGDGAISPSFCIAKCQPGRFYDQALRSCRTCDYGFYQDGIGAFACKPCGVGLTTARQGAVNSQACVSPSSITTTTTESSGQLNTGAATEDEGSNAGIIAAIVLGCLIGLLLIILIICFCCCRDIFPCFKKQKQIVAPSTKEGYYTDKYGSPNMQFVSYNLRDVREKKGRPLDRMPIVEPPLSDETGSVKTDISVHVPVFKEKLDGRVRKKALYMSNGGQVMNASRGRSLYSSTEPTPRTYEMPRSYEGPPLTSSPRDAHYDEVFEDESPRRQRTKKRRRKHRKDRSGERSHRSATRSPHHGVSVRRSLRSRSSGPVGGSYDPDYDEIPMDKVSGSMPKALAPMPHRLKSLPQSDVHLRPLSPFSRPRAPVKPNEYQDFLEVTSKKSPQKPHYSSRSYDDDVPEDTDGSYMRRIEVESDEDLR